MAKTKKVAKKANSVVKKTSKKAVKKAVKKVAVSKKITKKVTKTSVVKSNPVSAKVSKSKKKYEISTILFFIAMASIIIFGVYLLMNSENESYHKQTETPIVFNSSKLNMIAISDPTCETCVVDVVLEQMKERIFPNMLAHKINSTSLTAQKYIDELNIKFLPAYIFEEKVTNDSKWISLNGAFLPVVFENNTYYIVNHQNIPNKVFTKDLEVTENTITLGNPDAKVTFYEFSDYECEFCAIAEGNENLVAQFQKQQPDYQPPVQKIIDEYVTTGKIKYVFYNFPLESIHVRSRDAHNAALCANEQNKFREYSEMIFDGRDFWTTNAYPKQLFVNYAESVSLNMTQFNECLNSQKYDDQITDEISMIREYGVTATPGFAVNRVYINGAQDYRLIKDIIDKELAKVE